MTSLPPPGTTNSRRNATLTASSSPDARSLSASRSRPARGRPPFRTSPVPPLRDPLIQFLNCVRSIFLVQELAAAIEQRAEVVGAFFEFRIPGVDVLFVSLL